MIFRRETPPVAEPPHEHDDGCEGEVLLGGCWGDLAALAIAAIAGFLIAAALKGWI